MKILLIGLMFLNGAVFATNIDKKHMLDELKIAHELKKEIQIQKTLFFNSHKSLEQEDYRCNFNGLKIEKNNKVLFYFTYNKKLNRNIALFDKKDTEIIRNDFSTLMGFVRHFVQNNIVNFCIPRPLDNWIGRTAKIKELGGHRHNNSMTYYDGYNISVKK